MIHNLHPPSPDRVVGYGIRWTSEHLEVPCPTCHAPRGTYCYRDHGYHAARTAASRHPVNAEARWVADHLERAARDRHIGLTFHRRAHQCGALGPHRLADCRPVVVDTAEDAA